MERLQQLLQQARRAYREMELAKAVGYRDDGTLIMAHDHRMAKAAFEEAVGEADRLVHDIQSTGCQIKSIDSGLVDFPAMINGNEVFLCWQLGEERVAYYHSLDSGYAGRRPILPGDDDTPWP